MDCYRSVRRQRPWRCREDQHVSIGVFYVELCYDGRILNVLVGFACLYPGQHGLAVRAPEPGPVALDKQALLEPLLDGPPAGFKIIIFRCKVRVKPAAPRRDLLVEIEPHGLVALCEFLAGVYELVDPDFLLYV